MTKVSTAAREEILDKVRASLGRTTALPVALVPPAARIPRREAGGPEDELDLLLSEIADLGGHVRRVNGPADLVAALAALVASEAVTRATLWPIPELGALGLAEMLASLGVTLVPPGASLREVAACDLGITGVDGALPETGTLLLRSGPERPRAVSLLPSVHLALLTPSALRADLQDALSPGPEASCMTLITGPSRTSDIELTLTIGVHGPKALYVWVLV